MKHVDETRFASSNAGLTPAHLRHLALGHYRNVISSMVYAAASAAGLLTKP